MIGVSVTCEITCTLLFRILLLITEGVRRQPHPMVPRCCWCGAYTYPTEGYTVPLARHGLPGHYIAVLILTLENDLVVEQQSVPMVLVSLLTYRQQAVTRKQLRGTLLSSLGYRAPARLSPRPSSILAAIGVSGSNPVGGYYYSIAATSRSLD